MDAATNTLLTQTGAGTPMGELLRRYWHPIVALSELEDNPIKPVRLLGEDLVAYRDFSGNYGLVDRHCAHRRADMSYGFVEEVGIRCNYHGWLYDHQGKCIGQPFEDMVDPTMRARAAVKMKSYRVEPLAGLLWAYLGPEPAPFVPNWEPFTWKNGFTQIVLSEVPCNWFQCQENSIDPVHFEWMHDNWSVRLKGGGAYAPRHLKVDFEEFDYGIQYKRIREGADESHPLWTIGRVCLWPYALFTGNHFEWRVPIDDEKTLSVGWFFSRVPKDKEPYVQKRIPYWYAPVKDPQTGRWITSHVMNQDYVAWVGQGIVADRTQEHLARSDRGIAMMRQRYLSDLKKIAAGEDPKATIRDPKLKDCVPLPIAARKELTEGLERDYLARTLVSGTSKPLGGSGMRDFVWLVGQPEDVKRAYQEAMGY